jgi:hypothetical protein
MAASGAAGVEDPWHVRVPDDASELGEQVAGLQDEPVEDEPADAEAVRA